ncbi:MAG: CPBP family intramembrane metalloprotease [Lachnospiraceae bacterium]|nr:CPBP family intramembrane metalloprotease [Lachnospiraceae bacterium]
MKPDDKRQTALAKAAGGIGSDAAKKTALRAVLIFLATSLVFVLLQCYSYANWQDNEVLSYVTYLAFLFSPLLGCVLARLITREGFRDGILWPKFLGNGKAYLFAFLIPTVMSFLGAVLSALLLGEGLTIKLDGGLRMGILTLLLCFAQLYYVAFITAGEELGWRALLYDKLEILIGTNGAVILGGILWGVWHFPVLYYIGANFGKDYPGFPFLGILLMCVATVFLGAPLWLVRKMSGSVIPACLFHGVIDSICSGLLTLFLTQEVASKKTCLVGVYGFVLPSVIVGIPFWIYLLRLGKAEKTKGYTK